MGPIVLRDVDQSASRRVKRSFAARLSDGITEQTQKVCNCTELGHSSSAAHSPRTSRVAALSFTHAATPKKPLSAQPEDRSAALEFTRLDRPA